MMRSLNAGVSGLQQYQEMMDVVGNNIANVNTVGYKANEVTLEDMISQTEAGAMAPTDDSGGTDPRQVGLGVTSGTISTIFTQGNLQTSSSPTDLAIQGNGFFQIKLPNGETAYTRNGNFQLDSQGNVVTSDGNPLVPSINIPSNATNVTIGTDGTVSVTQPGQTKSQQLGQIQLATFPNPGGLNSLGSNLFLPTTASGDALVDVPGGNGGLGTLQQGMLEQSNVSLVNEFVQMILAQRSYESNSRALSAADQMLQQLNSLGR